MILSSSDILEMETIYLEMKIEELEEENKELKKQIQNYKILSQLIDNIRGENDDRNRNITAN